MRRKGVATFWTCRNAMHILLLTQYYPPEPMKLLSDLAETLQEFGHRVTVLTGYPNWPDGHLYPGYRMALHSAETVNGVRVVRVPLYPNHGMSAWKRTANCTSFMASAMLLGPLLVDRPDIIHAIQPPTTCLPAWWLSRRWHIPFTYEVQDMWPESLAATGLLQKPRLLAGIAAYCRWVYRQAAAVRVISPGFRHNLLEKGVSADKVHFIPNWVDIDFYRGIPGDDPDIVDKPAGEFTILYAGSIGLAQGLEVVLEAAERLRDLPAVRFMLAGDGIALADLQQAARERDLPNIRFLGRRPMQDMPHLYALADAFLVHLKDDPLFRMTIPHKTLTYLAAGKPIIAAVAGDVADIVQRAGAGICCPSGNAPALADAARRLYHAAPAQRKTMGHNGYRCACTTYNRREVVRQVSELLVSSAAHPALMPGTHYREVVKK